MTSFIARQRILFACSAGGMALAAIATPSVALAAGTTAGSTINNTASATYDAGNGPVTVPSNQISLTVDELLDVTVVSTNPGDVPTTPGATREVLTCSLTNNGNGPEAFRLGTIATNGGDNYDPTNVQIWLDNGDGIFNPVSDTLYTPGTNDPVLNPDQSRTIFVVGDTPGTVVSGNRAEVVLTAESSTVLANGNNNTPGFTMAGQGAGGSNAVVGATGADSLANAFYVVNAASVSLVKSATVKDPWNGTQPVPGAIITYTITANVAGTGSVNGLVISDPVPAGSTYQPGTIKLGGSAQSDAVDGDAGSFGGNSVTVNLGTVAGGQTRTITFDVKIN